MKGFTTFVMSLAVATCLFDMAQAEDKKEHKILCDGKEMNMKESYTAEGMKECFDKYAPEQELAADATDADKKKAKMTQFVMAHNSTCFNVCKFKVQKMFDENDAFSQTGTDAMVDKVYPTESAAAIKAGLTKCTEGKTMSMDNECESYKEFMICMHKNHMDVCKIDPKDFMKKTE